MLTQVISEIGEIEQGDLPAAAAAPGSRTRSCSESESTGCPKLTPGEIGWSAGLDDANDTHARTQNTQRTRKLFTVLGLYFNPYMPGGNIAMPPPLSDELVDVLFSC